MLFYLQFFFTIDNRGLSWWVSPCLSSCCYPVTSEFMRRHVPLFIVANFLLFWIWKSLSLVGPCKFSKWWEAFLFPSTSQFAYSNTSIIFQVGDFCTYFSEAFTPWRGSYIWVVWFRILFDYFFEMDSSKV